jgi:hypothetical protein
MNFIDRQKEKALNKNLKKIHDKRVAEAAEAKKAMGLKNPQSVVPDGIPGAMPDGIPGTIPGTIPDGIPGAIPNGMPGTIPNGIPGTIPNGIPGTIPSVIPPINIPGELPIPGIPKELPKLDNLGGLEEFKVDNPASSFKYTYKPYKLLPNQGKATELDPTAKAAIPVISNTIADDIETSEDKKDQIGKGLFQKLIDSIDVKEFKKQLGPMMKKELNAIYENNLDMQESLCKIWLLAFRSRTYPIFNEVFQTMSGKELKGSDKLNVPGANQSSSESEQEDLTITKTKLDIADRNYLEHQKEQRENDKKREARKSQAIGVDIPEEADDEGNAQGYEGNAKGYEGNAQESGMVKMSGGEKMPGSQIYNTFIYYKRAFLESIVDKHAMFNSASNRTVVNSQKALLVKMVGHFALIPREILVGKLSKMIVGLEDFKELSENGEAPEGDDHLFGIFNRILNKFTNGKLKQPGVEYEDSEEEYDGDNAEEHNEEEHNEEENNKEASPSESAPAPVSAPTSETGSTTTGGGAKLNASKLIKMRDQMMKLWNVSQKLKQVANSHHRDSINAFRGGGKGEGENTKTPASNYDDNSLKSRPRYMPASYDWYYIEKKVAEDLEKYIVKLFKQSENNVKDAFKNVCKQYNAAYLNDYGETSIMRKYAQEEFNNMILGFCENINDTTAEQILYHYAFGRGFDDFEEALSGDVFAEENHPFTVESVIGYGRIVKKFFNTDVFELKFPRRSFENISVNSQAIKDSVVDTFSEPEPETEDLEADEPAAEVSKTEEPAAEGSKTEELEAKEPETKTESLTPDAATVDPEKGDSKLAPENVQAGGGGGNESIAEAPVTPEATVNAVKQDELEKGMANPETKNKPDKETKAMPDFAKINFNSKKYNDAFTAWPLSYKWEPAMLKVAYNVMDDIFYAALQDTAFLGEIFKIYSNSSVQFMQDIVDDFKHKQSEIEKFIQNYVIIKHSHIKPILTKCIEETIGLWLTKKAEECDPKHLAIYTMFLLYFLLSSPDKKMAWKSQNQNADEMETQEMEMQGYDDSNEGDQAESVEDSKKESDQTKPAEGSKEEGDQTKQEEDSKKESDQTKPVDDSKKEDGQTKPADDSKKEDGQTKPAEDSKKEGDQVEPAEDFTEENYDSTEIETDTEENDHTIEANKDSRPKPNLTKPHIYNPIDEPINNAIREFSDIFLNGDTDILDHFRAISNESSMQFEYNQFFVKAMQAAEEAKNEGTENETETSNSEQAGGTRADAGGTRVDTGGTKMYKPSEAHLKARRNNITLRNRGAKHKTTHRVIGK